MTATFPLGAGLVWVALSALLAPVPAGAYGKPGAAPSPAVAASPSPATARPTVVRLVDLNSASREDLKSLPGIDDAAAERIVAARPYPSKAKLVSEKVISFELFLSLKDRVVAMQQPAFRAHGAVSGSKQP